MKYIKLYENFQGRKPISNKDWYLFKAVNKKFSTRYWIRKNLFDNGDGTFDYEGRLNFYKMEIKSFSEAIPLPVKNVSGDFLCQYCKELDTLKYAPQSVGKDFYCAHCTGLTSLKGAPQSVGDSFICWGCKGLISVVNDYSHEIVNWDGYSKEDVQNYLNSEQFSSPIWFESLAFIGARDPKAYVQVCKDFPNETTFTQEQVEEIYKSDLIDYESTLVDAAKAGLPIPQEIMDRTKSYDHSEYRDSKLDSEWKEIF